VNAGQCHATIWRADLREFTSWLEGVSERRTACRAERDTKRHQDAKSVLLAWRETDALNKTKLDIMLTGKLGRLPNSRVLRSESKHFSSEEKLPFGTS